MTAFSAPLCLDPALVEFLEGPMAIGLSACAADGRPRAVWGVGCHVSGRQIEVYLPAGPAAALVHAARERDAVAAVFCLPGPERAVQIKGDGVEVRPATAEDRARVARCREDWERALMAAGYSADFARVVHGWPLDQLLTLSFAPRQLYTQTPGPRAGSVLTEPTP